MPTGDGLVSYWKMDESANATRIDSHGSFDLTDRNSNVGAATGFFNGGALFDGGTSSTDFLEHATRRAELWQ